MRTGWKDPVTAIRATRRTSRIGAFYENEANRSMTAFHHGCPHLHYSGASMRVRSRTSQPPLCGVGLSESEDHHSMRMGLNAPQPPNMRFR